MKYYKIDIKDRYPELGRIASSANGKKIKNADDYFWKMKKEGIIDDAPPIFDYFVLQSFDIEKHWEWLLTDVFDFIGKGSQIPGWLISKKLKFLLENFNIAEPYFYYASKLLYKDQKLDYYIFQFSGNKIFKDTFSYINFDKSIFLDPIKKDNIKVENLENFLLEYKRIYKENDIENKLKNKKLVLKNDLDFIPIGTTMADNLISEKLKQEIEDNGITGFEFSELDYEVVVDL